MAKRRRLTAPDASELEQLEEGFAAKPKLETKAMAPIAQVAGEAAALANAADPTERLDAALLRSARDKGLVAEEIPLDQIDADFISRDRIELSEEEFEELKQSIQAQGQRTPIEVTKTKDGYGLISGWRRLTVLKALAESGQGEATAKAFVREGREANEIYLDMVEENEIRANLTHYERGRIASVAASQGVYANLEEAVNHLFAAASKAKRSKVRSFAALHDGVGDLLKFPTRLTEKTGLKLAQAIGAGQLAELRKALGTADAQTQEDELNVLQGYLTGAKIAKPKGGRPPSAKVTSMKLNGVGEVKASISPRGCRIDIEGRSISPDIVERILQHIQKTLR